MQAGRTGQNSSTLETKPEPIPKLKTYTNQGKKGSEGKGNIRKTHPAVVCR